MIRSIYETHLEVSNLEQAVEFYKKLDLQLAGIVPDRRIAFFWIGVPGSQMLGLWEVKAAEPVSTHHFAFDVSLDDLKQATTWLAERGIETRGAFGKDPLEPIVHQWMPAASVYFYDLDGNSLEFITMLSTAEETRRAFEQPVEVLSTPAVYLSEWQSQ